MSGRKPRVCAQIELSQIRLALKSLREARQLAHGQRAQRRRLRSTRHQVGRRRRASRARCDVSTGKETMTASDWVDVLALAGTFLGGGTILVIALAWWMNLLRWTFDRLEEGLR